ncbi:glycosyltransferase family 4 protein [Echinicola marina]|uniref:glycosyltransferase family 4 protein n=1 Tax=Echinicola marina TaxID=2859768 RepID=UPI001CF6C1AA|nr:glycosyltransferase family 4 protein [Echinicola marina]UCS93060.1 glycosyltransferase family 4 protein [Echinicola marina]
MPKLIRVTTVPISLKLLLAGQMKYMKDAGWEVLMVSAEGKEVHEVKRKEGCEHFEIPFSRKITPLHDLICLWKLIQLFKQEKPDIVHTHTPKAGLLGMIAAKFAGVKVRIHTVAGMPYVVTKDNKRKLLETMEKWTFGNASHVWPNANSLKDFILKEKLCVPEKMEVLGNGSSNGVDLGRFNRDNLKENHLVAATMRVMPGENDFIILAVGRLVKDKGIEELVNAFLNSKIINQSKLVLLGDFEQDLNPLEEDVIRKIEDHPRIVQVNWSEHVEHYMAISDVLVHASHREGFPNVLLEAGAMQLPIICSDINGNIDIVTNKKTGLVFPAKDKAVLKEALEFAFVKRDVMQTLADHLYVEVTSKYDRKKMHALILDKYRELTAK